MNDKTTITFTGDIGFDKYMANAWSDQKLLSPKVVSFLRASDHIVANVEGPLYRPNDETAKDGAKALIHSMDPGAASFLERIGADIWNINNNHIMDAGPEGMKATLLEAQKHHAVTLGAGNTEAEAKAPIYLKEAGGIGLIGVGYDRACRKAIGENPGCFSWSDEDAIREAICKIKKTARWCVIVAHAGEEFTPLPSPYTRKRYLDYLDMGADIVVCHHPHVPMNYELFENKAIFYSLGNFVFDTDYQRSQFYTEFGVLLKITFSKETFSFESLGIKVNRANEHIISCALPKIYTNVKENDYKALIPYSTKAFLEATKRQLRYLKPHEFTNADEAKFLENFYEPMRSGRVPNEVLDFQILVPLSKTCDETAWKKCRKASVKQYILNMMKS